MERIVKEQQIGKLIYEGAIERVGREAFNDVIRSFQTIGTDKELVKEKFYEFDFGRSLGKMFLMSLNELKLYPNKHLDALRLQIHPKACCN